MITRLIPVAIATLAICAVVLPNAAAATNVSAAAAASVQVSVVASGFDSPRGVAISDGHILVAESGHGGDVCIPSPYGPNCIGLSSQISVVDPRGGESLPRVSQTAGFETGLMNRMRMLLT